MSAIDIIRGRQTATRTLTNKSGGSVAQGDIVVIGDGTNDNSFTTTTTASFNSRMVGVAMETIANNAAGLVALHGYVPLVNSNSSSLTRDRFLFTHTVAKTCTASATRAAGAFGQVLETGTNPEAIIFGMPDPTPGTASITRNTYGTTSQGASNQGSRATYFKKVTLPSNGFLAEIGAWIKGDATNAGGVSAAIYSDAAAPVNLISAGQPIIDPAATTYDANVKLNTTYRIIHFPIGAWLTAGDYWLGVKLYGGGDSRVFLAYSSTSGGTDLSQAAATWWVDTSITAIASTTNDWSIFASVLT